MAGYRVTDVREISSMTPAGRTQKFYRVWLQTDAGAYGTIDVPEDKWNKADLAKILAQRAEELDLAFTVSQKS